VITTIVLILIGAEIYSVAESVNYMNSLWWAIATTTTVGYGDISPHTEVGRFVAVALMILGIGLIGSVTSTVTAFFVDDKTDKDNDALKKALQDIKLELKKIRKEYRNSWPDHVVPVCFGGIVEVNTMAFISSNYNKYHKFVLRPPCLGCYYNRCVGILLCNWITRREKRTVIKYY
ncbi:MAG: potassium channel family protein, partial [Leuconostoc mesenteroides]